MEKIEFNHDAKTFYQSFGVSEERADELIAVMTRCKAENYKKSIALEKAIKEVDASPKDLLVFGFLAAC